PPSPQSSAGSARRVLRKTRGSCSRSRSDTTWQARSSSTALCARPSTSSKSFASTITSARRRYRTSWCSGSPTRWSSGRGAARGGGGGGGGGGAGAHGRRGAREAGGRGGRARHYEEAGALRDMVQNHLLQVLSFVAMEPPDSLAPENVRDRKAELLEAVRPFS